MQYIKDKSIPIEQVEAGTIFSHDNSFYLRPIKGSGFSGIDLSDGTLIGMSKGTPVFIYPNISLIIK